jgi:hypothetical protein
LGLGTYTLQFAKGLSYLSNDPTQCANGHIMKDHLDSWQKSSHHGRAARYFSGVSDVFTRLTKRASAGAEAIHPPAAAGDATKVTPAGNGARRRTPGHTTSPNGAPG